MVGGCSVTTRTAETAACEVSSGPPPSRIATDVATNTMPTSWIGPDPTSSTSTSASAIPSGTPTDTSIARSSRAPTVSPSVMIAATGAKNAPLVPKIPLAIIHAAPAPSARQQQGGGERPPRARRPRARGARGGTA